MNHSFDPGYFEEPFRTLASNYPEADTYPFSQFRVEWGPIFHRGRLDGSARVLIIGQDPAQHETIVRRILAGEAGRRVQGFMGKLGIVTSYVMINTFLYSVYGSVRAATRRNPSLIGYRNQWIDALMNSRKIEAVVALGTAAGEAWKFWKATPTGKASNVVFAQITHPTQPESFSKKDHTKLAPATKKLLDNWNVALQALAPAVQHQDVPGAVSPYGETWTDGDRTSLPEGDFPAGLPAWMHEQDGWATRKAKDDLGKRRNITITVPKATIP